MFCLAPKAADNLKNDILSGKIDFEKLNNATSEERMNMFRDYVGDENVREFEVNLEKKLLLKNSQAGIVKLLHETLGLSDEEKQDLQNKTQVRLDELQRKKDRLFNPKNGEPVLSELLKEKALSKYANRTSIDPSDIVQMHTLLDKEFVDNLTNDIYSRKYKTELSPEETKKITELAQGVQTAEKELAAKGYVEDINFDWKNDEDKNTIGLDLASKRVAMDEYIDGLKDAHTRLTWMKGESGEAIWNNVKFVANTLLNNSKTLVAGVDQGFFLRQGRKAATNIDTAKIWWQDYYKSLGDSFKIAKSKDPAATMMDIQRAQKVEIYSRAGFMSGRYKLGQPLDISGKSEYFPTEPTFLSKIINKIPGRLQYGSRTMYETGAMKLRADCTDMYYKLADLRGEDLTDKDVVGGINAGVNSMTGSSNFGKFENTKKFFNTFLFSAKFQKSIMDTITHLWSKTPMQREIAAKSLAGLVVSSALAIAIAHTLDPKSTDLHPGSSNFGKVKIFGNWTDVTGGAISYLTLAYRLLSNSKTSSTTGITSPLNGGYGSESGMNVLWDFVDGKTSPFAGMLEDIINRQTYSGQKISLTHPISSGAALGETMFEPMQAQAILDSLKSKQTLPEGLANFILSFSGLSAHPEDNNTNWTQNPGAEVTAFQKHLNDPVKFKEANDLYNQKVQAMTKSYEANPTWKTLTDTQKQSQITSMKAAQQKAVFKQYDFGYKPVKTPKIKL